MAFGSTRQQEAKKVEKSEGSEEKQAMQWPLIPIKGGITDKFGKVTEIKGGLRKIRMLPKLDEHGKLVQVPLTDRNGHVVKGKLTTVPDEEVRYVEFWWNFFANGSDKKKYPVWIDWQGEGRWNNPLWEGCKGFAGIKHAEKGSDERKGLKEYFMVNVLDKTPVLFDDQGYPVYPDENGKYCINAFAKVREPLTGDPTPLNQIRILQGTSGRTDPPGKHFYQEFVKLIGTVENPDNPKMVYNIHEFDISINVNGAGVNTVRSVNATLYLKPLADEFVYAPRYDLAAWVKPWPNEAIEKLFAGHDYFEVMKEYGIQQYPQLKPVVPTNETKETAVNDEEDLFEE